MAKEVVFVSARCNNCDRTVGTIVQAEPYDRWLGGGVNVQDVFPRLSAAEREVLIGKRKGWYLCDFGCWDKVLGGDDDEDDDEDDT